jgi:hypothetical protein
MKKILVVLLILAVAGGVFAQQGEWSLGGKVEVGTRVDFDPVPDVDDNDPALVDGIGYNEYDSIMGQLTLGYTKGDVTISLNFNSKADNYIDTAFNGDNFKGQFNVSGLVDLITNSPYDDAVNDGYKPWQRWGSIGRLWGEFKFLNGLVTLLPAFASPDVHYWVSDTSGAYGGVANHVSDWKTSGNPFYSGDTFTKYDHHNYLMSAVELGGLNLGIVIPNLFLPNNGAWADYGTVTGDSTRPGKYGFLPPDYAGSATGQKDPSGKFIDDSLRQLKVGLSFAQSPFEFAAQFYFENYGIYFGGKFFAGPITVGLSFMGELDGDGKKYGEDENAADPKHIRIGGSVDYSGSGFGAGLKGFYEMAEYADGGVKLEQYLTKIGVQPVFYYDVIPSHLRFKLDAGMYFLNLTDGSENNKATVWGLQPQLFWNFKGTGAGDNYYWPLDTAIFIRYRVANADVRDVYPDLNGSVNFLDVVFKWSF